jgi:hypothetical protein
MANPFLERYAVDTPSVHRRFPASNVGSGNEVGNPSVQMDESNQQREGKAAGDRPD